MRGQTHVAIAFMLFPEITNGCVSLDSCGSVGKLTRICATVSDPSFASAHPRRNAAAPFLVLGGFTDFIVASTFANGHGAITGLANVAPVRDDWFRCL